MQEPVQYIYLEKNMVPAGLLKILRINAEAENEYGTQIRSDLIEYVYRLISCKPDEFDSLEAQLKSDMDNAGLTDIIEGRAALYDEEMAAAE